MSRPSAVTSPLLVSLLVLMQFLGTATAVLSADSSTAAHPPKSSQPIKIGFVTSLSGVAAPGGRDMANGIELFMDQIHNRIAGRPVQLIVKNDACNPATAKAEVSQLANQDKVDVIAGFLLGNVGDAVAQQSDVSHVPFVITISAGDELTQNQHHQWIVRTAPTASQLSLPFGDWVYRELDFRDIITFGMDYSYGYEIIGAFQQSFEDAGGKIVQKIWAPLGFTDFQPYIEKMRRDADAVFALNVGNAALIMPKQYAQYGPKLPIIGGGAGFDEAILRHLGDEVLGCYSSCSYCPVLDNSENRQFVAAYRAKYHEDPSYFSESAYTTGLVIKKAVEALKGDTSSHTALMAALKKVTVQAPRGPLYFDEFGQGVFNIYVLKVQKANGKLHNTVVATFPNVSQFWKYNRAQFLHQPLYSKDYPPCKYCDTKN